MVEQPYNSRRDLILAEIDNERAGQVGRGYDAAHDDGHREGEIAAAAACFALSTTADTRPHYGLMGFIRKVWPWDICFYKQREKRAQLVVAAALLVAEIERIDREAARRG